MKRKQAKYSDELKQSIIARLLAPVNASIPELSKESGIPVGTLYTWRHKYQGDATTVAQSNKNQFSAAERLDIIIATAALNEVELGEYCRSKGLYPEQISAWKQALIKEDAVKPTREERARTRAQENKIKSLQRELHRKEKALAEAAALLVLQKKLQALLDNEEGEEKFPTSSAR